MKRRQFLELALGAWIVSLIVQPASAETTPAAGNKEGLPSPTLLEEPLPKYDLVQYLSEEELLELLKRYLEEGFITPQIRKELLEGNLSEINHFRLTYLGTFPIPEFGNVRPFNDVLNNSEKVEYDSKFRLYFPEGFNEEDHRIVKDYVTGNCAFLLFDEILKILVERLQVSYPDSHILENLKKIGGIVICPYYSHQNAALFGGSAMTLLESDDGIWGFVGINMSKLSPFVNQDKFFSSLLFDEIFDVLRIIVRYLVEKGQIDHTQIYRSYDTDGFVNAISNSLCRTLRIYIEEYWKQQYGENVDLNQAGNTFHKLLNATQKKEFILSVFHKIMSDEKWFNFIVKDLIDSNYPSSHYPSALFNQGGGFRSDATEARINEFQEQVLGKAIEAYRNLFTENTEGARSNTFSELIIAVLRALGYPTIEGFGSYSS
jgi:hypothetical protein